MSKNIGLYFGSFNPIHIGHLLVATHIREAAKLDEVWFIVSPQNPFKQQSELADENQRLEMVKLAIEQTTYFKVSDIELNLPKPSYTYITLIELNKQFPLHKFHLIIGEDNVAKLHEWKEIKRILENHKILVYNRITENTTSQISNLSRFNLPLFNISSTEIRKRIKDHLSIKYFVTENVEQYIAFHNLYN